MEKYNKFKISALTWTEKFEVPDRSYSASDIQDHFKYLKKYEEKTDNPSVKIYVNKIENRITFKIKTAYYFIFLKTFDSEFSYIEVWFTDQNSKPLEIEDKINIT